MRGSEVMHFVNVLTLAYTKVCILIELTEKSGLTCSLLAGKIGSIY